MKKVAVVVLALALLTMTFAAVPVMADPTQGQKVPVSIQWTPTGTTVLERHDTDGFSHRVLRRTWTVKLFIDGSSTPIEGTAVSVGEVLWAYTKLQMAVYNDYFELSFPTGGFEGNTHMQLYNYDATAKTYDIQIHAIFHGTGAYEGQTLNVGRDRGPAAFEWEGYLLKP